MGGWGMRVGGGALALLACLALAVRGMPAVRADGCNTPVLSLDEIARTATVAIVADVATEKGDDLNGYTSTLRVRGTLKGEPLGPALALDGLGHPGGVCDGGPRLTPGNRYVLFLAPLAAASPGKPQLALVNADEGVYTLTPQGTRFPPDRAGGGPQLQPIPAAAFARDVGAAGSVDPARVEAVIDALQLPETLDTPPIAGTASPGGTPGWVPSRAVILAAGLAALVAAGLVALLWRPANRERW